MYIIIFDIMMINHQKKLENIDLIWSADDCLLLQRVSENPSDILTIKVSCVFIDRGFFLLKIFTFCC